MIVNLRDICAIAEQKNMAIASFNVPSLEATRAALRSGKRRVMTYLPTGCHAPGTQVMRADGTLKQLSEKWYGADLTQVQ